LFLSKSKADLQLTTSPSFFCIVGGRYPELARQEIVALLESYGASNIQCPRPDLVIAEGNCEIEKVSKRAAFTQYIVKKLETEEDLSVLRGKTFACYGTNDIKLRDKVVEEIKKKTNSSVSVTHPDYQIIIKTITSQNDYRQSPRNLVGIRVPQVVIDWKERTSHLTNQFHPTMLNARISRAMINLAKVKEGDMVLDPFCGAGGILIEGKELKMKTLGFDVARKMCVAAKKNLDENIVECNSMQMPLKLDRIDAIVTDVPYGHSTRIIKGITRRDMLKDFLASIKKGRIRSAVIMCQSEDEVIIRKTGFNITNICRLYWHKSLTRSIITITPW
jgi:tRNA (guanine10-N2)-dimethyltransferase